MTGWAEWSPVEEPPDNGRQVLLWGYYELSGDPTYAVGAYDGTFGFLSSPPIDPLIWCELPAAAPGALAARRR